MSYFGTAPPSWQGCAYKSRYRPYGPYRLLIQNLFGTACQNIQQCGQIGNVYGFVSVNIQTVLSASRNIRIVCQVVQQCGQIGNAHNTVAVQVTGYTGGIESLNLAVKVILSLNAEPTVYSVSPLYQPRNTQPSLAGSTGATTLLPSATTSSA